MNLPPPLRLTDGDDVPRPGHHWPGTARLKDGAHCTYALEPGRWYAVVGNSPSLDGRRIQWAIDLGDGDAAVLVDEHLLELGPDDPAAFQRWAADCQQENAELDRE